MKAAILRTLELKDSSTYLDICRICLLKPNWMNLEVCALLLKVVLELLFEVYEEYVFYYEEE